MKQSIFINDDNQSNLNFIKLSKKEKLLLMRECLYNDLYKKLKNLYLRKRELINNYKQSVKDLDKQIGALK